MRTIGGQASIHCLYQMEGDMNESELGVAQDDVVKAESSSLKSKIWSESKKMWIVAGPAILIPFSTIGIHVISQVFIGQISATELAAYALIYTVIFRVFLGIQFGMVNGVGTLSGQAFGAKQYHKLGIYLQQSCIILLVVSALLTPMFIFASPILRALGQDHKIAYVAGKYAMWFIAVTFLYGVLYSFNSFLQSQSKNFILSLYAVLSLLVHIFLCWLLSVKLKLGCRETWRGFTALAFKDLGLTTKFSLASGVMICLEFCYNTILILLTGNMENAEVTIDALSICLNITGWAQAVCSGFLSAVSVRVSNELGRKDVKAAKLSILVAVLTSYSTLDWGLLVLFLIFRANAA